MSIDPGYRIMDIKCTPTREQLDPESLVKRDLGIPAIESTTAKVNNVAVKVLSAPVTFIGRALLFTALLVGSCLMAPSALLYATEQSLIHKTSWKKVAAYSLGVYFCCLKAALGMQGYQWSNKINENITLGAIPVQGQLEALKKEGITDVLCLTEDFELATSTLLTQPIKPKEWQESKMTVHHLPSPDLLPVPLDVLKTAANTIQDAVINNRKIYVHCKAGVGRSAMAVISYFIQHKGMSAHAAIAFVQKQRPAMNLRSPQIDQLYKFETECIRERCKVALEGASLETLETCLKQASQSTRPHRAPSSPTLYSLQQALKGSFPKNCWDCFCGDELNTLLSNTIQQHPDYIKREAREALCKLGKNTVLELSAHLENNPLLLSVLQGMLEKESPEVKWTRFDAEKLKTLAHEALAQAHLDAPSTTIIKEKEGARLPVLPPTPPLTPPSEHKTMTNLP